MRNILRIIVAFFILSSCTEEKHTFTESEIAIIPKPENFKLHEDSFEFLASSSISIESEEQNMAANYLRDLFKNANAFELKIQKDLKGASIQFKNNPTIKSEGYQLIITTDQITINASDAPGYFYGVQTLRQLLPTTIESNSELSQKWIVPCISIQDQPRFKWRGMHMDFSRHFFSIDEVKTFLDYMALYKLNTYHMHLTDDQGWRIEIKKYPLLTEKGAWRVESNHDVQCIELAKTNPMYAIDEQHYHNKNGVKMYGGYYTQDQIKEIIDYAADRNIEVVPEIDMPGHFKSAIDNYPYLSCTGEAGWGELFSQPACLGKPTSYEFVKDILSEVAELFPSKYIHIGGDEVNIKSWKDCGHCQATIKKHQLKDEHELQSYFNRVIEAFLKTKGKKMIGWDEIVSGGASRETTIMWWRNWAPKARYKATGNGSDLILTPDFEYYFDFKNEATPINKVYNYEPVPEDFTSAQANHVLGVQANIWTERIPNFDRLEFQTFPRMLALAETGWSSKENREFNNFANRLEFHYPRLDALGINYYIPSVIGLKENIGFVDHSNIELSTTDEVMEIYYTLDGTIPTKSSTKYTTPIQLSENGIIRAITVKGNAQSEIITSNVYKKAYINSLNVNLKNEGFQRWSVSGQFKDVNSIKLPTKPTWEKVADLNLRKFSGKQHTSFVFKGNFKAEEDGVYEFSSKSRSGNLIYVGGTLVVDKADSNKNGLIALKKGWHEIQIRYHQVNRPNDLKVWVATPNKKKVFLSKSKIGF